MDITSHVPDAPPAWVKRFAKLGLSAKGIVYCLIGILAFMAAFELGGKNNQDTDKAGVFSFILDQPFGKILLGIVALGLLCYTLWRLIQGINDTEQKGSDAKGIAVRARYIFSGLVYGGFAFLALQLILGNGGGSGGDSRETLASELLKQPFGQWLVGLVAVGTIITGLYQIYYGLSEKYKKKIQKSGFKSQIEHTMIRAGKIGYVARGVVWVIIGYMFLQAALKSNAQEAGGSQSAFAFLENSSYGSYLLGAVALGLICYGVFMFMRARYQEV
ncbi:DUF1206 domain-containing protein [Pontibacter arcticus]|uniref:DUF1206 domain-containing protein n=1 Tax=Pontibacter arcticus TaxID=2080288 RepID=A0A364RGJ5_9BACT|nr:DUF1206 domain-containing protein [Pontibacter arcticus]RAU83306.1 hypothetical protein DP923_08855 [Pontibacter arcticus]